MTNRIKREVETMLGPNARIAWEKKEQDEEKQAHKDAIIEFTQKSPRARKAWNSVGLNVNAKTFVPKGGKRKRKSTRRRKMSQKNKRRKQYTKKTRK